MGGVDQSNSMLTEKWKPVVDTLDGRAYRFGSYKRDGIATLCENTHRHVEYGQMARPDTFNIPLDSSEKSAKYLTDSLTILLNAWDMLESRGISVRVATNRVISHESKAYEVVYCKLEDFNLGIFQGSETAYLYDINYEQNQIGYIKI